MYALAICASPRKDSNTETLLAHALAPLKNAGWECNTLHIANHVMSGCRACMGCKKNQNNKCVITTDHFNEVYAEMLKADAILLGSPTYFTDVSAEMKALIDRSGYVAGSNNNPLAGKIGAAVIAVRRGGATQAYDTINHLFLKMGMIVPGSTYWNMGYGLNPGDVLNDAEGISNMRNLGEMIAWLGQAIKPHLGSIPK